MLRIAEHQRLLAVLVRDDELIAVLTRRAAYERDRAVITAPRSDLALPVAKVEQVAAPLRTTWMSPNSTLR
ncbi:hypothetical protein HUA78_45160 [Myxococcus sp. CA033]|uniref:hypothetical protein n=1 Tax=Myxococcus sp. CA033 TaxID=2741516 RepID=UPI00157AB7D2|nr:hypothetical protein [Myxococcus sp. CA033]NTX41644.1 hypothetical protein [Myxococcus sp. CA033]